MSAISKLLGNQKYVVVQQDDKEEPSKGPSLKNIMQSRGKGKAKLAPLSIKLYMTSSQTSAAATAQAPVQRVRPSDSAEFSSLATLYDEYICHGGRFHWRIYQSAGTVGGVDAGIAFDPMDATAYGGLIGLMSASQKEAPISTGAAGTCAPSAMNKSGYYKFSFKLPKGPQALPTATSGTISSGQWQETSVTAADWGYIKGYVTAAVSGTSVMEWFLEMDCVFRSRT